MKLFLSSIAAAILVTTGCSTTPTATDKFIADVQTNYVPKLVLQTNVVTVVQTNQVTQTVTITNSVGTPVPVFITNEITYVTYSTNVVMATNLVPIYSLTVNSNTTATAQAAGQIASIFVPGAGGLVTSGLLALVSIFLGVRNRQFAGQNSVLSQSAGVLAQIIETGREILAKEPAGQKASDAFTQWMVTHQAQTETIGKITEIVKLYTNNAEAKAAADQILALIGQTPPKPPTV